MGKWFESQDGLSRFAFEHVKLFQIRDEGTRKFNDDGTSYTPEPIIRIYAIFDFVNPHPDDWGGHAEKLVGEYESLEAAKKVLDDLMRLCLADDAYKEGYARGVEDQRETERDADTNRLEMQHRQ